MDHKNKITSNADMSALTDTNQLLGRQALQAELDTRIGGQRLTPAQRRIVQTMVDNHSDLGFLSSMEIAEQANVSQPSVTRFAVALGFDGFQEMRKFLRSVSANSEATPESENNRYQQSVSAEIANLSDLIQSLSDLSLLNEMGKLLASSRPLPVLGLRASAAFATQFCYFAAKVHPDIRLLSGGGSILEDMIEQSAAAGGKTLLVFMMPLYPRETLRAIEIAKATGMKIAMVSDASYSDHEKLADVLLKVRINTKLTFDSYAAASVLVTVLLDAMCNNMKGEAEKRLERIDRSSKKRKVFSV